MQKILVVDDDPQFRSLLLPLLTKRGYTALEASTGRAASGLVKSEMPDLIVVDGLLPDTDGLSWIKKLRAEGVQTPVAFASAFWRDKKTFEKLTKELGVTLVVHKPVVAQVFVEQIDQKLASLRTVTEPSPAAEEPEIEVDVDIDEEFVQLRKSYGRALPGKGVEIAAAIERLRAGAANARQDVRGLAHRLRGTAGSYGFPMAGESAGHIEDLVADTSRELGGAEWSRLEGAVAALTAAAQLAAEQSGASPPAAAPPGDRVLVVDDDASFLGYVGELARRFAMDVLPALTEKAALDTARTQKPGAAILDVAMGPDETSFKLAAALRAIPGCESMPIAFISAGPTIATRIAAANAGGSLFITKPLDSNSFADAAQQLLALRPTKPRVLVVDADPAFRATTHATLSREGMQAEGTADANDILDRLERFRPDALLIDADLRGTSGLDVCRLVRTHPLWRDLPILFMTTQTSAQARVAAFKAGGDDCLGKPVVSEELVARIRARLERARFMSERADVDMLTGVSLRRSFMNRFGALLAGAEREETPVAIALIDVDHFKEVNDTRGHLSGDRVLSGFGKLLLTRFRANDLRCRWGGEEFMVAFPGETTETAAAIIDRLLEEVRGMTFEGDSSDRFGITFSAGVAAYPNDGSTVHDLVRTVDRRLYVAKRSGRDQVVSTG